MLSTLGPWYSIKEAFNQHGGWPFCVGGYKDVTRPTKTYRCDCARLGATDTDDDFSNFPCFSSWLSFIDHHFLFCPFFFLSPLVKSVRFFFFNLLLFKDPVASYSSICSSHFFMDSSTQTCYQNQWTEAWNQPLESSQPTYLGSDSQRRWHRRDLTL